MQYNITSSFIIKKQSEMARPSYYYLTVKIQTVKTVKVTSSVAL